MAEQVEMTTGATRREFLGKAVGTGMAVGLLASVGEAHAHDVNKEIRPPALPFPGRETQGEIPRHVSQTLLSEQGTLAAPIPDSRYRSWLKELKSLPVRTSSRRSALLNLWIGEYTMTAQEEPRKALHHFRLAKQRTKRDDALHGWACYNECLALTFDSQYNEARDAFGDLLYGYKKTGAKPLHGFNWQVAGSWMRRLSSRAEEFNRLAAMGIPRPPSLDAICGAGGLAMCLRALKLPYDKKTVLASVRVTGRGSTLQDLLDGCPKLGVNGYSVTITGKEALMKLPKPLVAHVERDHFVGVLETNERGVVYLCTDCGRWPGGRVEVTWEQWQAMIPGAALCVALPGTETDRVLAALVQRKPGGVTEPVQVAAAQGITGLSAALSPLYRKLASAVVGFDEPQAAQCGMPPGTPATNPEDNHAEDPVDPVNLSNGEEVYSCPPDMIVYNPNGPDVVFQRYYNSLRGFDPSYYFKLLGTGWSHSYNICIYDPHATEIIQNAVMQEGTGRVTVTGSNAPGTVNIPQEDGPDIIQQLYWQILRNGVDIANNVNWDGWGVGVEEDNGVRTILVRAPPHAVATSAPVYEVRLSVWDWDTESDVPISGTFRVSPRSVRPRSSSPKYLIQPNGSRQEFTNPTVPTASNPVVECTVTGGPTMRVQLCLLVGTGYYYVVTMADGSKWTFDSPSETREFGGFNYYAPGGLRYPIKRMEDRFGGGLVLEYGPHGGYNFPYVNFTPLAAIKDLRTDNVLLTIVGATTSTPYIQGSGQHGKVFYEKEWHSIGYPHDDWPTGQYELTEVSAVEPSISSSASYTRYRYEYQNIYNGLTDQDGNWQSVPLLHRVIEPRQIANGTVGLSAVATIHYEWYTCFASEVKDPYGNKHLYTQVDANGDPAWHSPYTRVDVRTPDDTQLVTSYTVLHDTNRNVSVRKDGSGVAVQTMQYTDPVNPYLPTAIADGNGRTSSMTYNSYGDVVTSTSPCGTITQFTYSTAPIPDHHLLQIQTGSVTPTTFEYYSTTGLLQKVTAPLPSGGTGDTTFVHDTFGHLTQMTAPGNNAVASFTIQISYTEAPTVGSGYPFDGDWQNWTGTVGTAATLMRRPRKMTDAAGVVTRFYYGNESDEVMGRVQSVRDPQGRATSFVYDIIGRVEAIYLPDGRSVSYEYLYQGGPVRQVRIYNGSTIHSETVYTYGLNNELLKTEGGAETVRYEYDGTNRPLSIYDGRDNCLAYYGYTDRGLLWYAGIGNGNDLVFRTFDYDNAGSITSQSDYSYGATSGTEVQYTYNHPNGFLSAVTYPATPGRNVSMTYDTLGRMTGRTDSTGTQSCTYNDANSVTQVSTHYTGLPALNVGYSYYADGSRAGMTTPAGTFAYEYDATGSMNHLQNPSNEVTTWTYTTDNHILRQLMANGVATDYEYDTAGRLAKLTNLMMGTTPQILSEYAIPTDGTGYDGNDYLKKVLATIPGATTLGGLTEYEYGSASGQNHVHWLVGETSARAGGYTAGYTYDPSANLTNFKGQTRNYDAQNQLTAGQGLGTFAYDERGNPTTYNGATLTFDEDNNPTVFGSLLSAGYNSSGLRAWKQDANGKRTYFLYDNMALLCEVDATGAVIATNTFGVNGLVSRTEWLATGTDQYDNLPTFYTFDERGNTSERCKSDGGLLSQSITDAYGKSIPFPADNNGGVFGAADRSTDVYNGFGARFGYYNDKETALILCTFRYYDTETGRWINGDPIGYEGGVNLYSYVNGNPIISVDPLGLDALFITGRNRLNPSYMNGHAKEYAKAYEMTHPGKKAHIVEAITKKAFIEAFNSGNYEIDQFAYVGHASGTSPKLLLGDDNSDGWFSSADIIELDKNRISSDAWMGLLGCHTIDGQYKDKSMAHEFAKYFNRPVRGYDGGLGFGVPVPWGLPKEEKPWFIYASHLPRGHGKKALPNGKTTAW